MIISQVLSFSYMIVYPIILHKYCYLYIRQERKGLAVSLSLRETHHFREVE